MLTKLLSRLFAETKDPITDLSARIALGALLVRIAKSDGEYELAEIQRIDLILGKRYDLNPVEAAKLRAQAEEIEHQAPDTVRFTKVLKDAVPYEERTAVIEALWEVVLADGTREAEEDALLRMVAPMLGVSDPDSARARQRAEARMAG